MALTKCTGNRLHIQRNGWDWVCVCGGWATDSRKPDRKSRWQMAKKTRASLKRDTAKELQQYQLNN